MGTAEHVREPGDPSTSSDPRNPVPVTTEAGRKSLVRHNPAVTKEDWARVPGVSPQLDEAADLHNEAIREVKVARQTAQKLGKKFKAEDEQRIEAYKTGLAVPEMTDPAERNAAITEASARVEAAESHLVNAAAYVVAVVQENEQAWLADIAQAKAAAQEKVEEAQRMLAEAHRAMGEAGRNEVWIKRTAANMPGSHISIDLLGVNVPSPPPDLRALVGSDL